MPERQGVTIEEPKSSGVPVSEYRLQAGTDARFSV